MRQLLQKPTEVSTNLAQHAGIDKPDKAQCVARHVTRFVTSHIPVINQYS